MGTILVNDAVSSALKDKRTVVAIGVSGGKDSCAAVFAVNDYLDFEGFEGQRTLIHAHLGAIEWEDSLPTCHRLAQWVEWPLLIVERAAGGLVERWEQRWENCLDRYCNLSCVKVILPWSTSSMRFCTSELKTDEICKGLVKRYPGAMIVSASGVRRDESTARAKTPVTMAHPKLCRHKAGTIGFCWNPIAHLTEAEVLEMCRVKRFALHEAYTKYDSDRVSCSFCILGSIKGLKAGAKCASNHVVYRRLVNLECKSAFAFQGNRWLGDVEPGLLGPGQPEALAAAKDMAELRKKAEEVIPKHMLYVKGWPTCIPTKAECELLAECRRIVGEIYGWPMKYTHGPDVRERYKDLFCERQLKEGA
jgi:hypothetical protein